MGKCKYEKLKLINNIITIAFICAFLLLLVNLFLTDQYEDFCHILLVSGISFIAVSVFRKLYKAPRPLENSPVDGEKELSQRKRGTSFPSRHTFCAFLIGIFFVRYAVLPGVILLLLAVLLGILRVQLRLHYPRDVICGAIVGILCGLL